MLNSKNSLNLKSDNTYKKSGYSRFSVDSITKKENKIHKGNSFQKISDRDEKDKKINKTEEVKVATVLTKKSEDSSFDDNRRTFMKVAGVAGIGLAASALLPKSTNAYVAGSTPTSNVVGIKNVSNAKINPATEEKQNQIIGNYAFIFDNTSTVNVAYVGTAPIGSATNSAVWRIKKIDETSGVVITWADGDDSFNNIWDNRVSLTYL